MLDFMVGTEAHGRILYIVLEASASLGRRSQWATYLEKIMGGTWNEGSSTVVHTRWTTTLVADFLSIGDFAEAERVLMPEVRTYSSLLHNAAFFRYADHRFVLRAM